MVALAAVALSGLQNALVCLILNWLIFFGNPGLFVAPDNAASLRWLVIGLAVISIGIRLVIRRRWPIPRAGATLAVFTLVSAAGSIATSYAPAVSLLKLATLGTTAVAIFSAYAQTEVKRDVMKQWLSAVLLFIPWASMPLLSMPIGYLRNGRGFQGILNHPQTLGVVCALSVAWFMLSPVRGRRDRRLALLTVVVSSVALLASHARTGVFACLILFTIIAALRWRNSLSVDGTLMGFKITPARLAVGMVGIPVLCGCAVIGIDQVERYVRKGGTQRLQETSILTAVQSTRRPMVKASIDNFVDHPVLGIGFGLPSSPNELAVRQLEGTRLPVSASAEKGVLYTGILEETGLTGASVFAVFVFLAILDVLRRGTVLDVGAVILVFLLNLGEAALLATGGHGVMLLSIIAFGAGSAVKSELREMSGGAA